MSLAEFDADHLSHSPNNYAPVCDAVSSDQQCKLPGNFNRAAYLQRGSSLGPITNETGNRVPAKFDACCYHLLHPASQLELNKARPKRPGLLGRALGSPTNAPVTAYGPRKRCPLRSVPDDLSSLVSGCRSAGVGSLNTIGKVAFDRRS
jgi:hypothetical protein